MVLCLKTWESRSSPGLPRTETSSLSMPSLYSRRRLAFDAGWSSPVARQAHNLKAAGSNPAPATNVYRKSPWRKKPGAFSLSRPTRRFFDGVLLGSPDLSSGKYTQSTFQVTATGSDTFSIQFANDNSANGLDNFSVAGAGAVPELSTWVMSLFGFAGLGLLARTGRRAPSRFGR